MTDSDFADSVVLVMNNLGPAPVGIIINRPTPIPVSRLFPDLKRLTQVRDKVYFGGPVDFGSVWFLFHATAPPEHAIQACEGVYLSADRHLLLQLLGRDKPMESLRIFVGHAGWAPGQLEAEIERHDWTLKRAETEAIFGDGSEHPGRRRRPRSAASCFNAFRALKEGDFRQPEAGAAVSIGTLVKYAGHYVLDKRRGATFEYPACLLFCFCIFQS